MALACATAGAALGWRAGQADALQRMVGSDEAWKARTFAWRYALGLERFHGVYGQDLWLLQSVYPELRDGFFVDVGSADGVEISNTKRLEDAGWTGVCVDPFPRNMASRRCEVFAVAVDGHAGRVLEFQGAGTYSGGLVAYAGWWVPDADKAETVKVTTTTLADVLDRANAPPFIHYMNVDIEGAEYDALTAFPFERYRVGAITVEHNNLRDRRDAIRDLLVSHGYRLEWAIRDQDWYVHGSLHDTE